MEWIYWLLLIVAAGACLVLTLFGLPGLWVMLILVAGYGWATEWVSIGPWTIAALLLLAIAAEVIESFASAFGAQRAGASKRAMLLSIVGAIAGGILLTGLIPIPIVGTLIGLCVGAFGGAVLGEVIKGKDRDQAVKSGLGAAAGRLAGTLVKLAIGGVMLVIVTVAALPSLRRSPSPASPPATAPARPAAAPATPLDVER